MSRRARYAIEWRKPSARTETGWTKWQHWTVAKTAEGAERSCEASRAFWGAANAMEFRIVDREAAS